MGDEETFNESVEDASCRPRNDHRDKDVTSEEVDGICMINDVPNESVGFLVKRCQ